jgi:hypothetical protein
MAETDLLGAMGISGFGKKSKSKQLDPMRFEKNRRDEVCKSAFYSYLYY